jgi:hypothetical protein
MRLPLTANTHRHNIRLAAPFSPKAHPAGSECVKDFLLNILLKPEYHAPSGGVFWLVFYIITIRVV